MALDSDSEKATIDALLEDLGGCGLYQVLLVITVFGACFIAAWSMVFMSYAAYDPGWTCESTLEAGANSINSLESEFNLSMPLKCAETNDTYMNVSASCTDFSACDKVIYNDDSSTIVTEWALSCDDVYLVSAMTSLQMGGVLIGTLLIGHLSNRCGRKATHFASLGVHACLHLVALASINWQMFAAIRFFIGMSTGCLIMTTFIYPMEFIPRNCRTPVSALPFWNIGGLSFSVTAMLLRSWRYLHIATAIIAAVLILPVFLVPESIRWLAVKGKTEQAYCVAKYVGKVNRKRTPNMNVIDEIAEDERIREKEKPRISVLDLYRPRFRKITLIVSIMWICFIFVYYGILFGVKSFSGTFYINLMITSCITTVSYPLAPVASNYLGRKLGCVSLLSVSALGCISLVILHFLPLKIDKGLANIILTLLMLCFLDTAWCIGTVYTVELYSTVLRSLGLSHASCVARIGGMLAPFLIAMDESKMYISHIVMTLCILAMGISLLFLPETKDRQMEDSMGYKSKRKPLFKNNECSNIEDILEI